MTKSFSSSSSSFFFLFKAKQRATLPVMPLTGQVDGVALVSENRGGNPDISGYFVRSPAERELP